jgi:hypothetical protein
LKGKFSSSITSGDNNRAWQEIANIEKEKRNLEIEKLKLEKFGFRLDIFLFSKVTNINIQAHPTWNAYPHKVIKACIIYLLKN